MKLVATEIPGVLIVEPAVHRDDRGFFLETWQARRYAEAGIDTPFVQDNHSSSARGILRGLHAQVRRPQAKLVRCAVGEVWDVAVDIRRGSPTFGRFVAASISGENQRQLFIPPGFAHGFCVTSERAHFEYKCSDYYDPSDEVAIAWNDPEIAIPWPLADPVLSAKDRGAPRLREIWDRLPVYGGPR